jgi:hypothetical protein
MIDTVIPAPPLVTVGFLARNALLRETRLETVVAVLTWQRQHLAHVVSCPSESGKTGGQIYWGYDGYVAPASRMINGTTMSAEIVCSGSPYQDPLVRHWTGGCGGTTGFSNAIMRGANIAPWVHAGPHHRSGFTVGPDERVWLAHSDDPYGIKRAPEIPTEALLLDESTFQAWFVDEPVAAKKEKNVSRRKADLYLDFLPMILTSYHCHLDVPYKWNHADSYVYGVFEATYPLAYVESAGVWHHIAEMVDLAGGCAKVPPVVW